MDKNAIKKFAIWARRELIERVSQRAAIYGITAEDHGAPEAESVNGKLLSASEKNQRRILINSIKEKGFEQVIEEVAYTWFNRFAALRFMEVNGYLPSHIRVFTNEAGEFKPQILSEAIHLDLEGLNKDKVYELENDNKTEELFKYLLVVQCNALNSILPGMFQRIDDYTELLLPDNLLREGSVIEQMVSTILEEDWTDQVQIIGWLYQYYNTELNDYVYDGSYARNKIEKHLIPAATTIYTPDWPVRYMVENSLGRLWLEGHPNETLKKEWKYYVDGVNQDDEVQSHLTQIYKEYAILKPEEIRVIDPCMGSGHILCVLFDTLIRIYENYGYTAREAAVKIVENNLWGLDIDERASQLSYFAVMMKARQYDRRFFARGIQPHVYSIRESNEIDPHYVDYYVDGKKELLSGIESIIRDLSDACEFGSILKVCPVDFDLLYERIEEIRNDPDMNLYSYCTVEAVLPLLHVAQTLAQQYHVVVTNPPYLGSSRFNSKLSNFIKKEYPNEKADLSMVMFRRALDSFCMKNGFVAFITTSSWMFLTSFEKMRKEILTNYAITSLVDFGTELFEGKVGHNPIVSWSVRKAKYRSVFKSIRLVDYCYARRDEKENEFYNSKNIYLTRQDNLAIIPGMPLAYNASDAFVDNFKKGVSVDTLSDFTGAQHKTADNERYVRYWREIDFTKFKHKWVPYIKGGEFRKWYGNLDLVVDWSKEALNFYASNTTSNLLAEKYRFREGITYTSLSSAANGFRYLPPIGVFDIKGPSMVNVKKLYYVLALFNTKIASLYFKAFNSTITLQVKDVKAFPIIIDPNVEEEIYHLALINVRLSKEDWDSRESSWDFSCHPLVRLRANGLIDQSFQRWEKECDIRFETVRENEEKINRIFTSLYLFEGEVDPTVDANDVTIHKANRSKDIRSLISYSVGCMFGRYSLDYPGIVFAGGEWDDSKYLSFSADKDGIIPISDDEYFTDDITQRFIEFIEIIYGKLHLEENLGFIASAIGGKGSSRDVIRNYFINDFFTDHCADCTVGVGGKRPYYWLFDSGKKNGFKCLIYLHRYKPDTIARIRTDYIHEQQSRYRTAIEDLNRRIDGASPSEKVKLNKQLTKVMDQAEELRVYEEKIHHLADQMIEIDLDDGVKVNYAKFQDVLANIK